MSEVFLHGYTTARSKDHGAGPSPIREAIMLGIMEHCIAHKPRWMYWFKGAIYFGLMRLLYVKWTPQ